MTCLNCNDERVVWKKSVIGLATCEPCPVCNKEGKAVDNEFRRNMRKRVEEYHARNKETNE
ncbi:hypothetical protein IGI57_002510 [Enterococcus sp. DIV0213j]|jgi:hypothetical protein